MISTAFIERMYPEEIETLENVGKLRKDDADDFSNVRTHCVVVAQAVHVVWCEFMRHEHEGAQVVKWALLHDITKRWEKRPQDFTANEAFRLGMVVGAIPEDIRVATAPHTEETDCQRTIGEIVLRWADISVADDEIVGYEERLKRTAHRWTQLDFELGMSIGARCDREIRREIFTRTGTNFASNGFHEIVKRRLEFL